MWMMIQSLMVMYESNIHTFKWLSLWIEFLVVPGYVVMCAILMCFAVDCANLCKAAGVCNWQSWEPSKVAPSPPPHTSHTLCHCQLALFQYFDGDHNENDADNDSEDSDDGDDVLLLTLFTLCANWRFSKGTAASKTLKVDLWQWYTCFWCPSPRSHCSAG